MECPGSMPLIVNRESKGGYKGEVVTLIVHHNRGVAESGTTSRKGEEMEALPVSYASNSSDMLECTSQEEGRDEGR